MKLSLVMVCVLDTIHQVTLAHLHYTHLIVNFADISDLDTINL